MPSFNVSQFLRAQGAKFEGVDSETGLVNITSTDLDTGKVSEGTFDPQEFLRSRGAPDDTEVIFNNDVTALPETPLSFSDQMDILSARTPGEKFRFVQNIFGKENVKRIGREIVAKDQDGVWKEVESGFLARVAKESPTIVAGGVGAVKGTAVGAAAGALLGPLAPIAVPVLGTVGAIIGGGIGAASSKAIEIGLAEQAGIRTESDAQDAMDEIGKEFVDSVVFGVAGVTAGKVLRAGKGLLKPAARSLDDWAVTAETMTNVPANNYRTLFNPESTKQTLAWRNIQLKWIRAGQQGVDPATRRIVKETSNIMRSAKVAQQAEFGAAKDLLKKQGALDVKVNMDDIFEEADLLKKLINDPNVPFSSIVDPTDVRLLNRTLDRITSARGATKAIKEGVDPLTGKLKVAIVPQEIRVEDVLTLRGNLDDILERSGAFRTGEFAISSTGRNAVKSLRNTLSNKVGKTLDSFPVNVNGELTSAGSVWSRSNSRYHEFRKTFDDFAVGKKFDPEKAEQTVRRMLGEKGALLEDRFKTLVELSGKSGERTMKTLREVNAGASLAPLYAKGRTGLGQVAVNIGSGGLTSPQFAERQLAIQRSIELGRKVTQPVLNTLSKAGRFTRFTSGMTIGEFRTFLSSPELFRGAVDATFQSISDEEQLSGQLSSSIIEAVQ